MEPLALDRRTSPTADGTGPRVVVFGSSGFIGSHSAAAIEGRGSPVVRVPHSEADLTDAVAIRRVLEPGDIVVNAAGYSAATDASREGRRQLHRSNVDGPRTLAEVASAVEVRQLIHISSVAAMGRVAGMGITEDCRGPVTSPYAESKRDGEMALWALESRAPLTVLRPTSVFGEGRPLAGLLCRIAHLPIVPLPNGGRALIPFTHVANIAHAVALTVNSRTCFDRTFIVGDPRSYPLRDILTALASAMGREPRFVSVPDSLAGASARGVEWLARLLGKRPPVDRTRLETLITSASFSIGPFEEATGYRPAVDFETATERLGRWYLGRMASD